MGVNDIDRSLDGLTYSLRHAWLELSARCAERRAWLVFLESLRSMERLEWLIANGKSWSSRSYHLPGAEDGKAAALDAAPILKVVGSVLEQINWDPETYQWEVYVETALGLGLECGANWNQKDWSHVQLQRRR